MSTVERSTEVRVPVRTAYDQFTQFEDFPQFMQDVEEIRQLDDTTVRWRARVAGVEREWDADITEQEPDQRIAWRSRGELHHAGVVTFHRLGEDRTRVMLQMELEPSDWVEKVGDALDVMERRVENDLESFREFIEQRGAPTGAWRGEVPQDPSS